MSANRPPPRKINPSTKLREDNAERPLLSSQRKSLADKAAAEAVSLSCAPLGRGSADAQPQAKISANKPPTTSTTTPGSEQSDLLPHNDLAVTRKQKAPCNDSNDVDNAGLYKDVNIITIDVTSDDNTFKKKDPKRDLDEFFEEPQRDGNSEKTRRRCKTCWDGKQCGKQDIMIVNEHSTLRRHMASRHKDIYQKWCKQSGFLSMLPDDSRERKRAATAQSQKEQTHVDNHFRTLGPDEKPIAYSEDLFRDVAVRWLIQTDQPIRALDHPAFKKMIAVAASVTRGVKIPERKRTRQTIINEFGIQMKLLKDRLNSKSVTGNIGLTCDAWQASNTDGYFATTGHWIEEHQPGKWLLQHALLGFAQMNTAHNGKRLGQALFKICDRLGIVHRIGSITCDNAANNNTMIIEFAYRYKLKTGLTFDIRRRHIRCLAHIINLATQTLISTRSKAKYFNPHEINEHIPELTGSDRDELGLIRAISVKERSSSQRKEMFRSIQIQNGIKIPTQLLLDMKVRWGSTYVMLHCAESLREHVDMFVYKLGTKAETPDQRRKTQALRLSDDEWERVGMFCSLLSYADRAQQAFSSAQVPTLFNAIPAIESLHAAWFSCSKKPKYARFHSALDKACEKLSSYYEKTADSDAHVFAMLLHPTRKMNYFKKHWDTNLQDEVLIIAKRIFIERYEKLYQGAVDGIPAILPPQKKKKTVGLPRKYDTDTDDSDNDEEDTTVDPSQPWMAEFQRYLNTAEILPEGMSVVEWWGINAHRYHVWSSLARDYLTMMASSVSSERAFSSAGITISKRRNRLKGDIVEALQFLKCTYQDDLIFRQIETSAEEESLLEEDKVEDEANEGANDFSWETVIVDDIADSDVDFIYD